MPKRTAAQPSSAADAANTPEAERLIDTQAAAQAAEVRVSETSPLLADASAVAPDADGTVVLSPEAQAVLNVSAALAAVPDSSPMHAVLTAALEAALEAQSAVEAQAALEAERDSEETAARAAALAHNLPAHILDAMLAAIDAKYAPAPEAEAAPEAAAPATYSGRKPVGTVTKARNAAVAEALTTDTALQARADSAIDGFKSDSAYLAGVQALAGTRYASIVTFASGSAGVANAADFVTLCTAVRIRLGQRGFPAGGQSTASVPWVTATGAHAASAPKGNDTLRLKFTDYRAVAQYPDGRFRLAAPGTPDVKFVHADATAFAAFTGGSAAASASAPHVPTAPTAPQAPTAPKPPTAPQAPQAPTRTARCQSCNVRNVLGAAACISCGAADWTATA